MQVSVEKMGELERRLTIQVPASDVESQISSQLNKLRSQVRLKGFRPGKVPMRVIQQRYGDQVREEVHQEVMRSKLAQAVEDESLRVASVTRLEPEADAADEFKFVAEMEVMPDLQNMDLADLEVEKPQAEITDADVDNMIETLREQRRQWGGVERPSQAGDRVRLEYSASVDGQAVPAEGHYHLAPVLGAGVLFEAFEAELAGVAAEEEKTVTLEFPENYHQTDLAGKTAEVNLKIEAVESSALPEVDDAFIESFGVSGGIEQLREDIRHNLERELRQATSNKVKLAVTDALTRRFGDLKLPVSMVRQEAMQLQSQYMQQSGSKEAPPLEQFSDSAERRVKIGLLLAEIARRNEIRIEDSRVDARIDEIAETFEKPSEVAALYYSTPHLLEGIRNLVLEEQVVEHVIAHAKVVDKAVSFAELMGQA